MKRDVLTEITNAIVAKLETCGKWKRPWDSLSSGLPCNATTHKAYKGGNSIWLACQPRSSSLWATYKQWEGIGAQVRKGERSCLIVKWTELKNKDETGRKILVPFAANVFNAEQVDGFTATIEPRTIPPVQAAETIMAQSGAVINYGGDKAFYVPSFDSVQLPPRGAFKNADGFYATAFHELGHWTGHKSRLDRDFSGRFGDESYAFEELVAELTAAFLCGATGVTNEPREDHASYIKRWLKVLKDDKRAIFTAASKASQAAELLNPEPKAEEERIAA